MLSNLNPRLSIITCFIQITSTSWNHIHNKANWIIDKDHINDTNYVYIIGSDFISTELHAINEYNAKTYTDLSLDYRYNSTDDPNRFYYRSDHYNFAKNNVPVIFFFNGTHEDYHQATDEVDKINYEILAKRTQLVFYDLWTLANMDKRIEVDVIQE